jgi:hypothetical protein
MIALRDNLPLIRHAGGYVSCFERDWLHRSLVEAAHKAGYEKWWLAEHVIESVVRYLEDQFVGNELCSSGLGRAVRSVLEGIGYGEVAAQFEPLPPARRVSLPELAARAGTGYELAFFQLLESELTLLAGLGVRTLVLDGLQPCVKRLRGAKAWRADCRVLSDEIVDFVRDRLGSATPAPASPPLALTLR